jgi:hypothetical protein
MRAFRGPAPLATLILLCFVTIASATVVGDLKTSSGNGTTAVTLTSITFNTNTAGSPPGPPWNGQVSNTTSLMFSGCNGTLGAVGCLDSGAFTPSESILFANGNPINAGAGFGPNNPFITFAGNGTAHATITYIITGFGAGSSNTNCATAVNPGDSCSVFAGSPIILTFTATGTNVSLTGFGTTTDSGGGTSNWIGQFSTPITGMTPLQVQTFFCPSGTCTAADFASGRAIVKPSGGDFLASTVPEPGTTALTLIGGGLIALAAFKRRKSRA